MSTADKHGVEVENVYWING